MPYTKEEMEEDIKRDRELEMQQDSYDEMEEIEHRRKLHSDLDYLYNQREIREALEALETLKEWSANYDLDYEEIIKGA